MEARKALEKVFEEWKAKKLTDTTLEVLVQECYDWDNFKDQDELEIERNSREFDPTHKGQPLRELLLVCHHHGCTWTKCLKLIAPLKEQWSYESVADVVVYLTQKGWNVGAGSDDALAETIMAFCAEGDLIFLSFLFGDLAENLDIEKLSYLLSLCCNWTSEKLLIFQDYCAKNWDCHDYLGDNSEYFFAWAHRAAEQNKIRSSDSVLNKLKKTLAEWKANPPTTATIEQKVKECLKNWDQDYKDKAEIEVEWTVREIDPDYRGQTLRELLLVCQHEGFTWAKCTKILAPLRSKWSIESVTDVTIYLSQKGWSVGAGDDNSIAATIATFTKGDLIFLSDVTGELVSQNIDLQRVAIWISLAYNWKVDLLDSFSQYCMDRWNAYSVLGEDNFDFLTSFAAKQCR